MSPFLNVKECAEYLHLSTSSIRKFVHFKQIPYRKHGAKVLFLKEEVEAWSQARIVQPKVTSMSRFESVRLRLCSLKTEVTAQPAYQKEVG